MSVACARRVRPAHRRADAASHAVKGGERRCEEVEAAPGSMVSGSELAQTRAGSGKSRGSHSKPSEGPANSTLEESSVTWSRRGGRSWRRKCPRPPVVPWGKVTSTWILTGDGLADGDVLVGGRVAGPGRVRGDRGDRDRRQGGGDLHGGDRPADHIQPRGVHRGRKGLARDHGGDGKGLAGGELGAVKAARKVMTIADEPMS